MLDDPLKEEVDRAMWAKYYEENPDADPIKVMCTMIAMVWISGMVMCTVLLIVAAIAWFFGIL